MSQILGKRKRRRVAEAEEKSSGDEAGDAVDFQALLRKHFESRFEPLETTATPAVEVVAAEPAQSDDEEDEGSDWAGLSDDEGPAVQIIVHDTKHEAAKLTGAELRAFMSSKPPSLTALKPTSTTKLSTPAKDDPAETLNLKNDLALSRLISESHLLTPGAAPVPRQKITELRLRALGSKTSVLEQRSMPMGHRKGIVAKAEQRERKRRSEAKENGIVLEKERFERKQVGKRERGVGGPAVGKFQGGTLKLSKKDVRDIKQTKTAPVRRATRR